MLQFLPVLVVVAAVLVLVDTSRLGARRGALGGGLLDMGPVAWFFCVLVGSVVALPAYLVVRRRLVALAAEPGTEPTAEPAPTPRRGGRHRAEGPARGARARRSRKDAERPATTVPDSVQDLVPVPALAPPFAAATSWAAAPEDDEVDETDLATLAYQTDQTDLADLADPADLAAPLDDVTVGAFAPGGSAPGPFAAGPFVTGPFAALAATAPTAPTPFEPVAAAEVAAVHGEWPDAAPVSHGSPALDAFAELVSNGLMSEAEYERVRARLETTTTV